MIVIDTESQIDKKYEDTKIVNRKIRHADTHRYEKIINRKVER